MSPIPRISFVICSRNDDYVENMLGRQQAAIEVLAGQLEDRRLPSEIIIVDWNPPPERPSLAEAMKIPSDLKWLTIRAIEVPGNCHRRYDQANLIAMNGAVGWNVGIRRARGEFVLPKSADTFYSENLMDWMAGPELKPGRVYRCDRYDIAAGALAKREHGAKSLFAAFDKNIVTRHERLDVPSDWGIADLHTNASGDFLLMARSLWETIRGFEETGRVIALDVDGIALHAAHGAGAAQVLLAENCRVYKPCTGNPIAGRVTRAWRADWMIFYALMAVARVPQRRRLKARHRFNFPRRKVRGLPGVLFDSYARNFIARAQKWAGGKGPFYLNGLDWGLALENLEEKVINRATWENL